MYVHNGVIVHSVPFFQYCKRANVYTIIMISFHTVYVCMCIILFKYLIISLSDLVLSATTHTS